MGLFDSFLSKRELSRFSLNPEESVSYIEENSEGVFYLHQDDAWFKRLWEEICEETY